MSQDTAQDNSLMPLIGRTWQLDAAIEDVQFDFDNKSIAFLTATGSLALAPVADPDSAQKRTRIQGDDGRIVVSPRTNPAPPLLQLTAPKSPFVMARAWHSGGFVAATGDSQVYRVKSDENIKLLWSKDNSALRSLTTTKRSQNIAILIDDEIVILNEDGAHVASRQLQRPAADIAFSPDGKRLASVDELGVTVWTVGQTLQEDRRLEHSAQYFRLGWSPSGRFITAALVDNGLHSWRMKDGLSVPMMDYPSPSQHFNWSKKDSVLATSGGYRIICWPLSDSDLAEAKTKPLETGMSGIVLVTAAAAQANGNLVAGGYANGIVVICEPGKPDELVLRGADGSAVKALAWSDDGNSLAIGTESGAAEVAGFPDYMFK